MPFFKVSWNSSRSYALSRKQVNDQYPILKNFIKKKLYQLINLLNCWRLYFMLVNNQRLILQVGCI